MKKNIRRCLPSHLQRGNEAETIAEQYLALQGLKKQGRNYRCRHGEIDLVMTDSGILVFIEVRYRSNPRYAGAAASVDRRKQRKLLRTAQCFLQRRPRLARRPCRFDVIAFEPAESDARPSPRWLRGAFGA